MFAKLQEIELKSKWIYLFFHVMLWNPINFNIIKPYLHQNSPCYIIHSSEPNSTDFIKPSAKHTIVSFGLVYNPNQLLWSPVVIGVAYFCVATLHWFLLCKGSVASIPVKVSLSLFLVDFSQTHRNFSYRQIGYPWKIYWKFLAHPFHPRFSHAHKNSIPSRPT